MATSKVGLFGTSTRTNTLLAIHLLGETHASEMAALLGRTLSRIQDAIESLERAGIVVGIEEGKARRVRLNPHYPAKSELEALLTKIGSEDVELQKLLAQKRRRPRRLGKEI